MEMRRCHIVIPEPLYEQIRRIAQRDHRSLSAQIVHYLATAVAGEHEERSAEAEERSPLPLKRRGLRGLKP